MNVAIVNDDPVIIEVMRRTIERKTEHRVVWTALDGAAAVETCRTQTPDLILMDLFMPGTDGVEATRQIMATTPCSILIVTGNVDQNTPLVFEAMGYGALDVVATPALRAGSGCGAALLRKIETLRKLTADAKPAASEVAPHFAAARAQGNTLLVIGASAGGPSALVTLLSGLPSTFPAPIVIVQHIDAKFDRTLATWLNERSPLHVRVAREGDRPLPGTALLAGGRGHLAFNSSDRMGYSSEPAENHYRPSVDVFFDSAARFWRGGIVGVLLTGMGRDGAAGLKKLRDDGNHTIAQDEASCAVYGMPKAAAALKAAVDILPLEDISRRLIGLFGGAQQPGARFGHG